VGNAILPFAKRPLTDQKEDVPFSEADSASAYCRSQIERYRQKGRAETKRIISLAKKIAKSDLPNRMLICQRLFESLSANHLMSLLCGYFVIIALERASLPQW